MAADIVARQCARVKRNTAIMQSNRRYYVKRSPLSCKAECRYHVKLNIAVMQSEKQFFHHAKRTAAIMQSGQPL